KSSWFIRVLMNAPRCWMVGGDGLAVGHFVYCIQFIGTRQPVWSNKMQKPSTLQSSTATPGISPAAAKPIGYNRSMKPRAHASSAAAAAPEKIGARHLPLNKMVADTIRERILAGEFGPGERLAEERLSEELGISRMPVREALRVLASEGMVTLNPRRGASVTQYSEAQAQELIEVR